MQLKITFTGPRLCHYNYDLTRSWFVSFDITNLITGETIRKQFRSGINFLHNRKDRVNAGNALIKFWEGKLDEGWHPFEELGNQPVSRFTLFTESLDFALRECKLAKKTKQDYGCTVNFVKTAVKDLQMSDKTVNEIKRPHIKLILSHLSDKQGWSNKAYNKHLTQLQAVLSRLEEWEVWEVNPAYRIKTLPVVETQKYNPLTETEKKIIAEYLFIHHYLYFVYLMVIYHTGMRPKEVLAMKVKVINLNDRVIRILPDIESENSKTKRIRQVPINDELLLFFRELQLHTCYPEMYVFGSPYQSGKGTKGSTTNGKGAMHPDYFKSSFVMIKRDTVTKLWRKIVRTTLGIDKYQYAMKHTGSDDKILAGIEVDALKEMYGHSSKYMTEKYISVLKAQRRKEIISKSPSFLAPNVTT